MTFAQFMSEQQGLITPADRMLYAPHIAPDKRYYDIVGDLPEEFCDLVIIQEKMTRGLRINSADDVIVAVSELECNFSQYEKFLCDLSEIIDSYISETFKRVETMVVGMGFVVLAWRRKEWREVVDQPRVLPQMVDPYSVFLPFEFN